MNAYHCDTCGTELKRFEAVLRGNAIDDEPTAWCRRDAVALGLVELPLPPVVVVPAQRVEQTSLLRRLVGQR